MSNSDKLVLVSGANGHVASVILLAFLEAGYTVRGTVRSQAKGDALRANYPAEYRSRIQIAVVPDITADGAFDEAVKGVDYFLHAASPLADTSKTQDNEKDIILPAIHGTLTALRSASKEPRIKKVVILSSIAAVFDNSRPSQANVNYDESSWNGLTYEDGKTGAPWTAYRVSKTLSEKAAWEFVEKEKPTFHLVAINPTYVYGKTQAPIDPANPFTGSNKFLSELLFNPNYDFTTSAGISAFVDVRDVAQAHLLAVEKDAANGRRFIVTAPRAFFSDYIPLITQSHPSLAPTLPRIPDGWTNAETFWLDRSASEEVLGLVYHTPEETLADTVSWMLEVSGKGEI